MAILDINSETAPEVQSISVEPSRAAELAWVVTWTDLLDTKFTIPGTKIRFGADFLMGLVPGIGDALSLEFSGVLIAPRAKHGASKSLVRPSQPSSTLRRGSQ